MQFQGQFLLPHFTVMAINLDTPFSRGQKHKDGIEKEHGELKEEGQSSILNTDPP